MELDLNEPLPPVELEFNPCPVCTRTFLPDALERHFKICAKVNLKRRKVFDSSKQRTIGGEVREQSEAKARSTGTDAVKSHKVPWKEKHHQLINIIRNARRSSSTTSVSPDYVHCPGCERHFSPKVAESHIEWCRSKMARIPPSPAPASMEAMERLKARTKYRPPLPNSTSSSIHRRRPSGSGNNDEYALNSKEPRPIHSAISQRVAPQQSQPRLTHSSPAELESSRRPLAHCTMKNQQTKNSTKAQAPSVVKFKDHFPNRMPVTTSNEYRKKEYDPYKQADKQMKDLIDSPPPPRVSKTVRGRHLNNSTINVRSRCHPRTKQNTQNEISQIQRRILNLSTNQNNDTCAAGDNLNTCLLDSQNDVANNNHIRKINMGKNTASEPKANHCQKEEKNDDEKPSHPQQPKGPWAEKSVCMLPQHMPHFCHQCGTRYPISTAKYCCECGYRRFSFNAL